MLGGLFFLLSIEPRIEFVRLKAKVKPIASILLLKNSIAIFCR